METEVETQGDVTVDGQVGSSSVSTDDMERIPEGSEVRVSNSRIHVTQWWKRAMPNIRGAHGSHF